MIKVFSILITIVALSAQATSLVAAQQFELRKGLFLVATKGLERSSFRNTVILLTQYDAMEGAVGITINRATGVRLNEIFPKLTVLEKNNHQLFAGGPVQPSALLVLTRANQATDRMQHVIADIHFATGLVNLTHILNTKNGNQIVRAYSGYAGWGSGQLENEINRGDWLVIPADPGLIFDKEPNKIWEELTKHWSGVWM